ncbi:ALK and LTK ligand 1 [Eublepharis macularius]|uniref:ALK and LTK ligand 1 n=1 Tax=Eublepharis macularius TaxID=481883 RepID=A0AA97JQJ8_EUBMA|nr:ALK and LTK ligand 1 [Eublepharis macularius]
MPEAKRCRPALQTLLFILLFASVATLTPGLEGSSAPRSRPRDLQAPAGDRRMLLELLLKALGDGGGGSHQVLPHPFGPERVIARRYSGSGALHPAPAVDQEPRGLALSSASSSRERMAGQPARLASIPRHGEVFPRDSNLKDKFIKHFTGPVTFSAECSKHFHRLYHNTRDCSTPAYYKRCARLLTRLAMSPLCTQP